MRQTTEVEMQRFWRPAENEIKELEILSKKLFLKFNFFFFLKKTLLSLKIRLEMPFAKAQHLQADAKAFSEGSSSQQ